MQLVDTAFKEELLNLENPGLAHFADASKVTEGYVMGTPVEAVCGKIFVPSQDPKKFPVCPICREIVEALNLDYEQ